MANLAAPNKKQEKDPNVLDDDISKSSYDLANSATATLFFDPEHLNQLVSAVEKSKDPSKVIGTALGQILMIAYNKLNQAELDVEDRVWASDGGVIDGIVDEVTEFFSEMGVQVDPSVIAQGVLDVLKDSPIAGGQEQAPPQAQPQQAPQLAAPQGGM